MILSDLAKYALTRSVARSLCDSWAYCLPTDFLHKRRYGDTQSSWRRSLIVDWSRECIVAKQLDWSSCSSIHELAFTTALCTVLHGDRKPHQQGQGELAKNFLFFIYIYYHLWW